MNYNSSDLSSDSFTDSLSNLSTDSFSLSPSDVSSSEDQYKLYQKILYEIAKYIQPYRSFKKELTLKLISNQAIELNKHKFLLNVHNNISNYYITNKIDGIRTFLYLSKNESYAVNDKCTKIDIHTSNTYILDTEKYEEIYYILDILMYDGKLICEEPFETRFGYFSKVAHIKNIKIKPFIRLTIDFKKQLSDLKNTQTIYNTDGIIFTPYNETYNKMKVYKYKPIDQLTIDFLIKKCDSKDENRGKHKYILFCGISYTVYIKLCMKLINNYNKIFPNINTKKLPDYFPIQFEPSDNKHIYIYYSIEDNLDNVVGEFIFNNGEWILKKKRNDRQIDVEAGNYFGNNYKIAETIWNSYSDPLIIENIENSSEYFQEHNNILQKASRNFNSYVKSQIFENIKKSEWVIDLASGKGQDLFRYSTVNVKNVIFLEIDKMALSELLERKHIFSFDKKYRNNLNILFKNVDLLDSPQININKINTIYSDTRIDTIICNFAFHYFVADSTSLKNICEFIAHYLRPSGRFIFTSFDGKSVFDLLAKHNGQWIVKNNDQIKYGIVQRYASNSVFENIGQKIGVLLPFSKNTFYDEYLINIDIISHELKKHNIILIKKSSFSHHISSYHGIPLDNNDKIYVGLYYYYIFEKKSQ